MNDNLILISGKSSTGKSASFMNLNNPTGVMYLNTETNKKLPFKSKFKEFSVTDPFQIYEAFSEAEKMPDVHTIIIDSLTFMMDQFESIHVLSSTNTMKAWGEYAQFFKNLMNLYVSKSSKNVIMTAHTMDVMNETEMINETIIKVKGSLMNNGIESYFSTVLAAKRMAIKKLNNTIAGSPLLTITAKEQAKEFKYVFQTDLTKETVNERIRSPINMWDTTETYIDNDVQLVIDRLHQFYK